jgi:hypothetical protein
MDDLVESMLMGRPKKALTGEKQPVFRSVNLRAREEWATWLEEAAEYCRTDVAKLIDVAVCKYVRDQGFDKLPPKRF